MIHATFFSSLLLGSMSQYLRDILSDIPPVDKMKVLILPDVSTSELETFLSFLFVDQEKLVSMTLVAHLFLRLLCNYGNMTIADT